MELAAVKEHKHIHVLKWLPQKDLLGQCQPEKKQIQSRLETVAKKRARALVRGLCARRVFSGSAPIE